MNDPVTAVVTTKDGVQFAVQTQRIAIANEQRYALSVTAEELEKIEDFKRLKSLDDLVVDEITPFRPKPKLTPIKGGKASPKIFGEDLPKV